jgi:hypothetical protein
VQLKQSKFRDVSSEFWPVYEEDIRDLRGELKSHSPREVRHHANAQKETLSIARGITQDYLHAGKYDEAKKPLTELWPPDPQLP